MSVENCKVQFIRPTYQNLKEWMEDLDNVYIGRGGVVFIEGERFPKKSSMFANPYKIGKDGTREEIIAKYKDYMIIKINTNSEFKKELCKLKNKKLGCWCTPQLCHGHVLLELIEEYAN